MAKAQIEITLRGGEDRGDRMRFEPLQTMQGSIQITPANDLQCKHIFTRLAWHTEGRGDRDQEVVDELDLFQGELHAGVPSYYTFHFALPESPWSYAGHYVNIIWAVEVVLDVPWQIDARASMPFILAPETSS